MANTFEGAVLTVTKTGASVTTSAASAGAAIPFCSSGEYPRYIRAAASAPAYFRIGPGAQTALATDLQVQPGDAVILSVPSGCTHFAALQVNAAGTVQVSPLENM
ncbi:hypothetical protein UFOVP73_52 [uncultured Caudovirales phage]|uniref:Uncharacterized protein n=1 Tax=uncultured Caudovirales phage TaxID=2100421 RepID=A0A6J7WI55_9CAUD|nr:hypothetical protein UFOVP73_52 [uncultured Caudovirales phage]CAB5194624.1 hypothetical protein UFOVP170_12 [uncultured Caudovirales phage]